MRCHSKGLAAIVLALAAGSAATPGAQLLHHWPFDEGSGATVGDTAGSADMAIQGSSGGWTVGPVDGARTFSGAGYAVTPGQNQVTDPGGAVAVAGWFRTAANTANRSFLFQFEREYEMRIRDGGLQVSFRGEVVSAPTWGADLDTGLWHHFVAQNDGATTSLYIDGEAVGSRSEVLTPLTLESKASALAAKQNGQRPFDGTLDDFRFYDGTLTPAEIRALAQVSDQPPTAHADSYTGASDSTLVVAGPGVLANDTEPDGDPVTAVLVADVGLGDLTLNPDGGFSYVPPAGFQGVVAFTYQAVDADGSSAPADVVITILDPSTTLTPEEVARIEGDLGITLTEQEKLDLASIVKPQVLAGWRSDANLRIESQRKADLAVEVVDAAGTPVAGAEVRLRMKRNRFNFGGVVTVMDLTDASGDLAAAGSTTADWQRVTKALFNSLGFNNALKPRIVSQHQFVPGFLTWAAANELPVRGHLLMWPGTGDVEDMDAPGAVAGVDYGVHLSNSSTSDHASYDVAGAVETYRTSARAQTDKDALEAVVDAEIEEWAGQWDVYEWDVINETLSNRLLMDILGYDQMAEWFRIAADHRVNPACKLLINEFQLASARFNAESTSYQTRRDTYFERIDRLIADGAPVDGIGFQSRFRFLDEYDPAVVYSRIDEFATRYPGLEIVGTEFEVKDDYHYVTGDLIQAYDETTRARVTEEVMTTYFSHDQVTGLSAWDFINPLPDGTDAAYSRALCYYGDGAGGADGPLVKLNGLVWYYLHRIRYHTDVSALSGAAGRASLRGFKGDYEVTASFGGVERTVAHSLDEDGILVITLDGVTVPPAGRLLEHFEFNDVAGTVLGSVAKSAGTAVFPGSTPNLAADGTGALAIRRHPTQTNAGSGNFLAGGPLEFGSRTSGRYELAFTIRGADLAGGDADGASVGFGLRDGTAGKPLYLIRLNKTSGGLVASTYMDSTYTHIHGFSGQLSLVDPVRIRSVVDLDAGTADVFLRIGAAPEVFKKQVSLSSLATRWDQLAFTAQNNQTDWGADDVVEIDEMSIRRMDPGTYEAWQAGIGWDGSVETGPDDDPDGDRLTNLMEFALGGDPLVPDAGAVMPRLVSGSGGLSYELTFGADSMDLEYWLQSTGDLADWGQEAPLRLHGGIGDVLQVPVPVAGTHRKFFRLAVSVPE